MIKCLLLSSSIFLIMSNAFSQNFQEIFEGGWGHSLFSSKPFFIDLDMDGLLDLIIGEWDGKDKQGFLQTSGIYICRLQAGLFSQSIKLILVK